MAGRRDRSRSPMRGNGNNRRDASNPENNKQDLSVMPNAMNSMMMANMYPQAGNMIMGGMYNMMMPNTLMGGPMMASGMDMMASTGMEVMAPPAMDMSAMAAQPIAASGTPMDISMIGGVMMDPSMMAMYPNMPAELPQEKKEINLKYSKLLPPLPNAHQPPKRPKPPGCRTIFVSGLPDKIREKVLAEIFERYGRVQVLRLSKKNFCHIRFDRENCVDAAMAISGYRIKLKDKDKDEVDDDNDNHASNGFIHVDYALSRDDQNEYERRQRQALRVQQQQMQELNAQQEAISRRSHSRRSPSPLRIQPFSNAAIVQLCEKIKAEDQFANTLPTLISWLERGECSKKNSNQFYSMIQATNSHIRRLYSEKIQHEEELQETRERVKNSIQQIITQLEQVAKVFSAATHQRVWDHFTKPQRKNIETWQKMTQEFQSLKDEFNEKFLNEDSDMNGFNSNTNMGYYNTDNEEVQQLKLANESLKFQLEAYKNEVEVIKADSHKEMEKFKAQFIARQALTTAMDKNPPLPQPIAKPPPPPPLPDDMEPKAEVKEEVDSGCGEARLIGVMSAFLQVHPQGASLDYVVSYVRALWEGATQASVHAVLQKHKDVFQPRTTGIGANIDTRWFFVAFDSK
ncbi:ecto-NOX disulfide-thiol exchanger 2-like [Aricia agestis]|uniref:ecto-NOX disulfide-thiol exchanger 2-like n=1 Tax=Aricia agestis TaxID=91739 RepID=UPI001C204080|nr:ecto-NOX disulfide-thiol exchanger 2-like [Aricia agestis]